MAWVRKITSLLTHTRRLRSGENGERPSLFYPIIIPPRASFVKGFLKVFYQSAFLFAIRLLIYVRTSSLVAFVISNPVICSAIDSLYISLFDKSLRLTMGAQQFFVE